jgi:ribosome biogenesis GTPase / thiamine phosphate phosphatase
MNLEQLGWNEEYAGNFEREYGNEFVPARISLEHRSLYMVMMERGEYHAVPTGKLLFDAFDRMDLPVVGDWVVSRIVGDTDPTITIHGVLPRFSVLCRKEAGTRTRAQALAANIDTLFLVIGLDGNFNLNRVERYLAMALDSGAQPVVLFTKADLRHDVDALVNQTMDRIGDAVVHAVSSLTGYGIDTLAPFLAEGKTVALFGSSGVGKSTLLNHLIGEDVQRTLEVREFDSKGRHSTTHRQMFKLPSGALLIDTPGIRELTLWDAGDGVAEAFDDIEELALSCRFSDCKHKSEPGCAVQEALESGQLDKSRWENYLKMMREVAHLESKTNNNTARAVKQRSKMLSKHIRTWKKSGVPEKE